MNCSKLCHQIRNPMHKTSNIRNFFAKTPRGNGNGRRNARNPKRPQVSSIKTMESGGKSKSKIEDAPSLKVSSRFKGIVGRVAFAFGFIYYMILAAFSHMKSYHLAANMYVLSSFVSDTINMFLGVEQFAGFYLSAAVLSSCSSLVYKAATFTPFVVSLGASGAISAALAYACYKIPNEQLQIIFLPSFQFKVEDASFLKHTYCFIASNQAAMISRLRFNAATKKELRPFKNPGKDRPSLHKYKKNSTSNFAHTSETSPVTSIKSVWLTLANASIFIGGTYLVLSGASIAWELNNKSSKIVKLLKSENWAVVERPNPKNIKELLNFLWNNQFQLHYKVIGTIALLNLVVCFVWRKMAITQSFMRRYFICDILSKNTFRSSSMLLSTISHERIFPLLVNVCIFANIGVAVAENMGAEQFVFFFASSGTMESRRKICSIFLSILI
uniref:rhomboid protease n=1 Tax=Romanomermis culicivorax TaxID=13658 RepID=A0A915KZJ0_ROMCU